MLFGKELKKIVCSMTFVLYAVAVFAMYMTQFANDTEPIQKPVPGQEDYGTKVREVPEVMMPAAITALQREYESGVFVAYPVGFYKEVHLTEKQDVQMQKVLQELSHEVTYERFRELMRQADDIIGGGSAYSDTYIVSKFSRVPMTYEEALAEYEEFVKEDRVTNAYARLFCDYLGIVVSVLPVFVAVALVNSDIRAGMEQLIYARRIASWKLVLVRYLALCIGMIVPVLLTAIHAHIGVAGQYTGCEMDFWAMYQYTGMWLVPNIMFTTALGMLLAECTAPLLAIVVQAALWFASIFSVRTVDIKPFGMVIRHNSLYGRDLFMEKWKDFVFNRSFLAVLSIVLVIVTVFVYEKKRKGAFYGIFKGRKNRLRKSEA